MLSDDKQIALTVRATVDKEGVEMPTGLVNLTLPKQVIKDFVYQLFEAECMSSVFPDAKVKADLAIELVASCLKRS